MNYIQDVADRIRSLIDPALLPEDGTEFLFAIYAVLAYTLGSSVEATDIHDAWSAWMSCLDPNHSSIVPFDQLDPATASDDLPFVTAIRTVAAQLGLGRH